MRKSKALRLQQALDLVESFTPAHQAVFAWDYRFLSDMARKLSANRKITKKQRNILDEKIDKGVPDLPTATPEQEMLSKALQNLNGLEQFSWEHRVGGELLGKLKRGWNLSEKQQKLVDSIIKKSEEWSSTPEPTPELRARVELIKELAKCYTGNYWYSHAKCASYIRLLEGSKYSEKDVENGEYAIRGQLKKWNKCIEKFPAGAYCKVPCRSQELAEACGVKKWEKAAGIVVSEPRVDRGGIMMDVLVGGQVFGFYAKNITTR